MDGGVEGTLALTTEPEAAALPDYLVRTYTWAYLSPTSIAFFDNPVVVDTILWGNFRRLVSEACAEFSAGQRILQAASVYGSLSADLAETVGRDGRLEVIDIAPVQVNNCRRKLVDYPHAEVRVADAAAPGRSGYDGVCCFFLLHEIPDDYKRRVVNALLASVRPGGKVVFVDYHRPVLLHPARYVVACVFRWLEPFATSLVESEIADFADHPEAYRWRKEVYFGGLFQKVVAEVPDGSVGGGETP
jgi:SAM-dependent methyltransferase